MATFIENAPEQICAAAKELLAKGLVEGTSGNISARMEDGNIAVTPSSLDYRVMTVDDIVIVNPAGEVVPVSAARHRRSTSTSPCMTAYEDIAVVHPLACRVRHHVRRGPPGHPELHRRVHRVPRRRHPLYRVRPSGSAELAEQVVKALESRGAALIANHGMVAVGTTMEKTMHNTALVERSAKIIWGGKQLGGIFPLPEKVNQNFASVYPYMR